MGWTPEILFGLAQDVANFGAGLLFLGPPLRQERPKRIVRSLKTRDQANADSNLNNLADSVMAEADSLGFDELDSTDYFLIIAGVVMLVLSSLCGIISKMLSAGVV